MYDLCYSILTHTQTLLCISIIHCVKSVGIRSFPDPCFVAFGLNMETYGAVFNRNTEKCGPRKAPNTDTFYALIITKNEFK